MSRATRNSSILLTPTWSDDLDHFRLLRASLARSPLASLEHHVIVQTEDLPLFREFASDPKVVLRSSADVLPPVVEARRRRARQISARAGRHLTRISGSLRRTLGWPRWPSYTGWHTQQLCKLAVASENENTTTIVLDSDVVVTPSAQATDFYAHDAIVCFAQWQPLSSLKGKVRKWVDNATALTGTPPDGEQKNINIYFDTPFVLDSEALRAMLSHLEKQSGLRWWQYLLKQPPRRWSEFGIYKQHLTTWENKPVDWRAPDQMHYIFDTSNAAAVVKQVTDLFHRPDIHYITIHSQSSGKHDWSAQTYTESLLEWINMQ